MCTSAQVLSAPAQWEQIPKWSLSGTINCEFITCDLLSISERFALLFLSQIYFLLKLSEFLEKKQFL